MSDTDNKPNFHFNDAIVEMLKSKLKETGSLPPLLIMVKDDKIMAAILSPELMENKDLLALTIQGELSKYNPEIYYIVTDAFVHRVKETNIGKGVNDYLSNSVGTNGKLLVPDSEKFEVINLLVTKVNPDSSKNRWMCLIEYHRDAEGKVTSFEPEEWHKDGEKGLSIKGRFVL